MKKLNGSVPISSILIAIVGLILLLMPSLTNKIIAFGIAVVLLLYGVYRIIRYVTTRDAAAAAMNNHDLAIGMVCAAVGLFMFFNISFVIGILPFLFGLLLIYGGARSIQTAFDVKRFHGLYWVLHLIIGIVFVIAGIAAIRDPFSIAQVLTRFIGVCLLVLGIYLAFSNRKVDQLRAEYMTEDDVTDRAKYMPQDGTADRPQYMPKDDIIDQEDVIRNQDKN